MRYLFALVISSLTIFCPVRVNALPSDEAQMVVRKYTYKTLTSYQRQLFDDFLEDELPTGMNVASVLTDHTSLRSKTRVAEALLFRNKAGDKENAAVILKWILQNQYQDPNTKIYGIWKTAVVGDKFDQNWREFIGCDLIIIRDKYKALLSKEMIDAIEEGLIHAAKGARVRNVSPDYTNISIMSAFLMEYVGTEFKIDELKQTGLQKARDIYKLYRKYNTFSEYNSPTYYGVTLVALAFWREMAFSEEIRKMGATLEKEFWHEIANFYNPNLKNMPGPYFRGYGMDMGKYFAITGMWIAIAVDDAKYAPLPNGKGPKYGEMSNIAPIFNLGLVIPQSDLAHLKSLPKSQFYSRTVPNKYLGDSLKKVTTMIHKDWMMGGVWGSRRSWNQIKTGTIHWKMADGDIGWLLVPGDGNINVGVDKTAMKVYLANVNAKNLTLYVYANNSASDSFADKLWTLPGMKLGIKTTLKTVSIENVASATFQKQWEVAEKYANIVKVVYEIPASWDAMNPLVEITPKK